MIRRSHIYWARIPDETKARPVLVVSPDVRNELANHLIVVPLTRTLRLAPWHVRLRRGEAGIPTSSMIKCELVTTILKTRLDPAPLGGTLSASRMREVERAIVLAIGVTDPRSLAEPL